VICKNRYRSSASDRIFNIISYSILSLGCLLILYPLYFIILAAFSDPQYVLSGQVVLIPKGITISGFKRIFHYAPLWRGYVNSIFYSVFGSIFSTACTLFAAYPLSRKDFPGRRILSVFILIPLFFQGGLIPQYIVINALGLRNTYWVLILVSGIQIMNIFIASSYLRATNIEELYEASVMDGCTHFGYFFKVLLPVSVPIVIVMLLLYGVWQWNDYFRAMIYLDHSEYYPIQLILKELLAYNQVSGSFFEMLSEDQEAYAEMLKAAESMKYGIIIVAAFPMLAVYMFLQKYFVAGVTAGSVKG